MTQSDKPSGEDARTAREEAFAVIERFVALERDGGLSDKGFAAVLMDQLQPYIGSTPGGSDG